jgi:CPA2 family monovalent cation:H+ antiporter-2
LVRLLEAAPWPEGAQVEVRLSAEPANDADPGIGLVIIAGFGLAGRWVADIFDRHGIAYTIVEKNPQTVRRQQLLGKTVVQGDISDPSIMLAAGVKKADILALTFPDEQAVLRATRIAREMHPEIYIVARTNYTSSGLEAAQLGADAVVKAEQAVANRFYELLLHKLQSAASSD